MKAIEGLTDYPNQKTTLVLEDGTRATLTMEYRPNQLGWVYNLSWNDSFLVEGCRMTISPNLLRQYHHLIPFGLALVATGAAEPMRQDDFATGRARLFILNSGEVAEVEAAILAL